MPGLQVSSWKAFDKVCPGLELFLDLMCQIPCDGVVNGLVLAICGQFESLLTIVDYCQVTAAGLLKHLSAP